MPGAAKLESFDPNPEANPFPKVDPKTLPFPPPRPPNPKLVPPPNPKLIAGFVLGGDVESAGGSVDGAFAAAKAPNPDTAG